MFSKVETVFLQVPALPSLYSLLFYYEWGAVLPFAFYSTHFQLSFAILPLSTDPVASKVPPSPLLLSFYNGISTKDISVDQHMCKLCHTLLQTEA